MNTTDTLFMPDAAIEAHFAAISGTMPRTKRKRLTSDLEIKNSLYCEILRQLMGSLQIDTPSILQVDPRATLKAWRARLNLQ